MRRGVGIWGPRLWQLQALAVTMLIAGGAVTFGEQSPRYTLLDAEPGPYTLQLLVTAERGWTDGTELRIAFDVVDEKDLAFVRIQGTHAALMRFRQGKTEVVGQTRSVRLAPSWNAAFQRREGRVRLVAAGRIVLDEPWSAPIRGRVGYWVSPGAQVQAPLLQPYEAAIVYDDFTREPDDMGLWTALAGQWRNTLVSAPQANPTQSANPFTFRTLAAPTALAATGYWFWDAYRVSVSTRPLGAKAVSLAAYVQDERNMLCFRWEEGGTDAPGARQLLLVRDGKQTLLASQKGGFEKDQWYRLELVVCPGRVEVLIDRYPVLKADTDAFGQGMVAVGAEHGEAVFDDLAVSAVEAPIWETPRINPTFLADETMTQDELFTLAGQWRQGDGGIRWNWGYYPGDVQLQIAASALSTPLTVLLRADGSRVENAYAVTVGYEGQRIEASLRRPADVALHGSCPAGPDDIVAISATGNTVQVRCAGVEALNFSDPTPLSGKLVGLVGATDNHINSAYVFSPNFRDYAFDSAPTDWFSTKGIWQVTTRWPCQPGWTFFGGTHDQNPTLYTKHTYSGDIVLEFFANLQMDVPPPPGYSRPSDLDAALCADGVNLDSGYTFIFAGWKNTKSAILRRGQVVAENHNAVFVDPTSSNPAFHRHWFRLRAEKIGNRVAFSVDGREILSYVDPDPLPGGRAAIFSFHNAPMIGRARLWFTQEHVGGVVASYLPASPAPPPRPRGEGPPIVCDFESDLGEWRTFTIPPPVELALDNTTAASGKQSLRIRNLVSGGAMGVYAVTTPFRVTDAHKLSFDYRLPPGVGVNVYVHAAGSWHSIRVSAEEPQESAVPQLGAISNVVCDGSWHHAEFDLLGPLTAMHPQSPVLNVRYVAFAAPEESYLRCGIGGNHRGATYWIDNFRIE